MIDRKEALKYVLSYLKQHHRQNSKIAIQKTMYFLKESGLPVSYSFGAHTYGPFSKEIMHDADQLEMEDELIIKNVSYDLGSAFQVDLSQDDKDQIEQHIQNFIDLINHNFDFNNLEIYGSVIYCRQILKKFDEPVNLDNVYRELKSWKGSKYSYSDVRPVYESVKDYFAL